MNTLKIASIAIVVVHLSSCTMNNPSTSYSTYETYNYENMQYYGHGVGSVDYGNYGNNQGYYPPSQATVPDSYYTGGNNRPVSHKDQDRNWVNNQNPQGYTIEIADGEKASQVAGKLYKTPKTDRTAQIKYYRDGKTYYKGVYGTYNTQEEAEKALNALPENVKQGAGVRNWGSVQGAAE
ncbi:SPOR domain-containing protein [Legionella genomosp. 1]|uniref:SPOR domain-containing protein n=1 Tax=Legionella genomosp. 1 TaxID=1093625 RepID=UPI0010552CA9|nr:SPOR domain-containing protein [Legionella genomosp. 1]